MVVSLDEPTQDVDKVMGHDEAQTAVEAGPFFQLGNHFKGQEYLIHEVLRDTLSFTGDDHFQNHFAFFLFPPTNLTAQLMMLACKEHGIGQ